jgi:hypothetical protein
MQARFGIPCKAFWLLTITRKKKKTPWTQRSGDTVDQPQSEYLTRPFTGPCQGLVSGLVAAVACQ